MRDIFIRHAFHSTVLQSAHSDANTFVIDELGLKNGIVRADIAVLNGYLVGYEIKGDKDNLLRLPTQINAYNDVFEKSFVIVSEKHLSKIISQIPDWWGIYVIKSSKSSLAEFKRLRNAKLNKHQKAFAIAQLLWKTEALELASNLLCKEVNPRTTKKDIYDLISKNSSAKELSKIVIQYLKRRENWRSNPIQL